MCKVFRYVRGLSGLVFPFVLSGCGQSGAVSVQMDVDLFTGNLRIYYPTGGLDSPPFLSSPAFSAPVPAGAVPVTSNVAQPVIANSLIPGVGEEIALATDCSSLVAVLLAVGH